MSWFRRNLGMDGFDFALQAALTCLFMIWVNVSHGPDEVYPVVVMTSLVVLGVRRAIGLRKAGRHGLTTGEMEAERIAELEQRVAELEAGQVQVADLAERLDFAERLLAQTSIPVRAIGSGDDR